MAEDQTETVSVDLCVIGAGSGGLSVAAGASQMGASVALIEKHKMGGDCLNYGCVPSKSLLAAGRRAAEARNLAPFGLRAEAPSVDWAAVHDHVHDVIAAIAPNDSVERFTALGVRVYQGAARFAGRRAVQVAGGPRIEAKWFVIATGSRPAAPPVPGLDGVPYYTNETIFGRQEPPGHLIVLGGGPIGLEMAQAHRRLGAGVTVLEMASILPRDDPELADVVRTRLLSEGVALHEGAKVGQVAKTGGGIAVTFEQDGRGREVTGDTLLVAAGRAPNIDELDVAAAGIETEDGRLKVDVSLRTTNRRVFAIGDAAGGYQFTHVAGYHAGIVIRRALLRLFWTKADHSAVPWVTYTDPELAHVGLTEAQARDRGGRVTVLRWPFAENDRAQAERDRDGFIKVVTGRKGHVLGASIAGPHAGELILPWVLAVQDRMKIGKIAGLIAPYPTLSEVSKRAAGSYFTPSLFGDRMKRVVRFLMRFA